MNSNTLKQGQELIALKQNGERILVIYSKPESEGHHKVWCSDEKRYMCLVTLRNPMSDFECKLINQVN